MPQLNCWRSIAGLIAVAALSLASGCLGFVHPITPPLPEEDRPCETIPQGCKHRVHIFVIHDFDPLDLSNLDGLCEHFHSLGFIKTHFGLPFHVYFFEKEIRRLHVEEPTSRFAIIGIGCGAPAARDLAGSLGGAGIQVDLLIYMDGVCVHQPPLDCPANAVHVVNILAAGRGGEDNVAGAANIACPDAGHFGTATNPVTLKILASELAVVALGVPIIEIMPLPAPGEFIPGQQPGAPVLPAPTPSRPTLPPPTPVSGDWNFLHEDGNSVGVPGAKPLPEAWNANLKDSPAR